MDGGSELERKRQERIKANAARLAELKAAAEEVAKPLRAQKAKQAAKQRTARDALAPAIRRAPTSRAAAARTRAKLRQQGASNADDAVSRGHDTDSDGGSAVSLAHGRDASGNAPFDDYDPLVDEAAGSSEHEGGSESLVNSDSDTEGQATAGWTHQLPHWRTSVPAAAAAAGAGPSEAEMLAMMEEDEDAQLQMALAMSMPQEAGGAAQAGAQQASAGAKAPQTAKPTSKGGKAVAAVKALPAGTVAATAERGSKKKGRQPKRKRKQDAEPPSEQEIAAVFQLFNRKGMSALIASDIQQVASDTLGIDFDQERLQNMMKRSCDILDRQQLRLTREDFTRMVRHYCG